MGPASTRVRPRSSSCCNALIFDPTSVEAFRSRSLGETACVLSAAGASDQANCSNLPRNCQASLAEPPVHVRPRPFVRLMVTYLAHRHLPFVWLLALSVAAGTLLAPAGGAGAQLLITGNDEKISFDETGKTVTHPPGKDTVSIIDIREPTKPRIVANLPLMNTITGPPVNLAITPDQHLALVANSLDWVKDGEGWKGMPDNKINVIDLTTSPPVQIGTVEAGKLPSGMAINRAGTLALVANRADDSVSTLSIEGKSVKLVGTVSVANPTTTPGTQAAPPATPSSRRDYARW